jgi:outer membrane biosynthesis protein TonB
MAARSFPPHPNGFPRAAGAGARQLRHHLPRRIHGGRHEAGDEAGNDSAPLTPSTLRAHRPEPGPNPAPDPVPDHVPNRDPMRDPEPEPEPAVEEPLNVEIPPPTRH